MAVNAPLVVGLGEALFDCFPDRQVLGGAPVNVVVQLNRLLQPDGGLAFPVTRVGEDDLGRRYIDELQRCGLKTAHVQIDSDRPTATVDVALKANGDASYHFASDVAWDRLEWRRDWSIIADSCDAICFGTLAQRSVESRVAIEKLLEEASDAILLFDVNLRQEFYSARILDRSLQLANAVKMNQDEFSEVSRLLHIAEAEAGDAWACEALTKKYNLDWVAITRGADGTTLYIDGDLHNGPPAKFPPQPGADSVGAGDACAAGLLVGALQGWSPSRTLDLANELGAYVASQPGATPTLPQAILDKAADL